METAIPQMDLSFKKIGEEMKPVIEKIEDEDSRIASLAGQAGWIALKDRINRKITAINESAKVSAETIGLIDNFENFGFKCAMRDLLVETLNGIIFDVDGTAKFLKEQKDEQKSGSEPVSEE